MRLWGVLPRGGGTGTCTRRSFTDLRGAWLEGHLRGLVGRCWKVWKELTGIGGRGGLCEGRAVCFREGEKGAERPYGARVGRETSGRLWSWPRSFGTRPERCYFDHVISKTLIRKTVPTPGIVRGRSAHHQLRSLQ